MGFPESPIGAYEGDIIGMLDTGIWPERESFSDEGLGAPPAKWKGICHTANNMTCSNKIIGARFYDTDNISGPYYDIKSPRDTWGNGSHTASTAAGQAVENASYYGIANGVARGGVPNARLALYKVSWGGGCNPADILAAFDDAIADGVEIFVSFPGLYFSNPVTQGTNRNWGTSINNFHLNGTSFPLVYSGNSGNVSMGVSPEVARLCLPGILSTLKAKGRVVLCDVLYDGSAAIFAEAVGIIMAFSFDEVALAFPVPAVTTTDVRAPTVVSFSSRGPNPITPDILKPDITAPDANILAAWSPLAFPSVWMFDDRQVDYYIISGTSMSCPHVTGAAAYIKAAHPTWSPAAIKSALMTTATIMDPRKNEDAEFAYGSGHINPVKAVDPGLVFDASEADYVDFLCKQGYNTTLLRMITGDSSVCPSTEPGKAWDLNYPSFPLSLLDGKQIQASYHRTVTNVGLPNSTYHSHVTMPPSFAVLVEPPVLTFSETGEKKSFTVIVTGSPIVQVPIVLGAIEWTDGNDHVVRTPIVVFNNNPSIFASLEDYPHKKNSHSWEGSTVYHKNGMFNAIRRISFLLVLKVILNIHETYASVMSTI
ncbi:hypothetical protein PVL29_021197 [Vitis rotundifolia]|uniref:Cucumisin n=1 Tax=Vitis rotundifolia TaxID=103349 RepID=A0AA38YYZ3_VITRO|nr:hypothetical protein PVL29_021197 [Vitis rotundifolia]